MVPLLVIVCWILLYFIFVSAVGYGLMYDDKVRARTHQRRISEASLLYVALAGGALGVKIAQQKFRHKTRKEPFRTSLNNMVIWNLAIMCLVSYVLYLRSGSVEEVWGAFFEGGATDRSRGVKVNRGLN